MKELQLRILAGAVVTESELPKAAKLQLLNFIESEATDAQIKVLIMDGEVTYLDEFAEQIVHDRWDALNMETAWKAKLAAGGLKKAQMMKIKKAGLYKKGQPGKAAAAFARRKALIAKRRAGGGRMPLGM